MFCRNCGREVCDEAVICPNCGVQLAPFNGSKSTQATNTLAIVGFVLSFFVSIAGLICSIIAYRKCRDEGLGGKGLAVAGIAISAVYMALKVIYIIAYIGIMCTAFGAL